MVDGVGTTHHIKLGTHYYMLRPNSYSRRQAPTFGARFSTGDPDFNNLSLWQHWAQRCFIGGMDQDLWADDAMYDQGIGLDTTDHEKVVLSRDLKRGSGSNWTVSSGSTAAGQGYKAFVYNSKLYVLTMANTGVESKLWEYNPSTDGWVDKTSIASKDICARSVTVYDGKVFIGGYSVATGKAKVIYDDGNLTSWTTLPLPSSTEDDARWAVCAMAAFQQKLYIAYGTRIWRFKDDQTKDGNTVFYKANASSASNKIVSMEVHLGFLYMLSANGHVHRTDGNTTFDIWNWDGQTEGVAIRSFDGRLFVLTFEYTNTTDVGYGALYQMSGSAVTLLKRWGDDNEKTRIGNMRVYDRRLWYGASNGLGVTGRAVFGVAVYDPIEDAHSISVQNSDSTTYPKGTAGVNWLVDDQIFFNGWLFAFVRGHGAFKTPYKPNDRTKGLRSYDISSRGALPVADMNGGWLTTSTYDAGTPGVKKLWRKVILDVTTPTNTAVVLAYSKDNGANWTTIGTVTATGDRRNVDFWINVTSTSFKLRITLSSTVSGSTPTLWGFVVSYMPLPEPNWMWTFTIVLADNVALLDDTVRAQDVEAELDYLSDLSRTKALVEFTDVDGVVWGTNGAGTLIYDIAANLRDLSQPLESDVTITLLEAVETY